MLFVSVNNQDKWGHETEISLIEPDLFFLDAESQLWVNREGAVC